MIKTKRVYDAPSRDDGYRILVDRLWPRGTSKEKAGVDLWLKEIAPSNELRKWYEHDPLKWEEFKRRYFKEIEGHQDLLDQIRQRAKKGRVTLVYGSREEKLNNAAALREYLAKSGK
jgi:uncharacterized protein YeaO (DUF488 family)